MVPATPTVTVEPETEATDGTELLYETGKPELAVAVKVKVGSPTTLFAKDPKVMVCVACVTLAVRPVGWVTL